MLTPVRRLDTFWNVLDYNIGDMATTGRRKAEERRLTILDIAREAGVSKSTVSLVLQGSPVVRPETRERVQAAIERLGYVYHRGAANLRRQKSDVVGMVINDLTNPFFAELAAGIEHGLHRAGIVPFLANTGENPIRQTEVLRLMREHGAVGFILCPALGTDRETMTEVEAWRLPVVTVMRRAPGKHDDLGHARQPSRCFARRAAPAAARAPADRLPRRPRRHGRAGGAQRRLPRSTRGGWAWRSIAA